MSIYRENVTQINYIFLDVIASLQAGVISFFLLSILHFLILLDIL